MLIKIIVLILVFSLGAYAGFSLKDDNIKDIVVIKSGIDPDELIAWIENYVHNYEYNSPPTTGEIVQKIISMKMKR